MIFVTATGTGVGKTFVAAGLAAAFRRRGIDIGVFKPVATGDQKDARALKRAAGVDDPISLINPVFLKPPLSPHLAGRVSLDRIWKAHRELARRHDKLVIEGVGGLMVPLQDDFLVVDLAARFRAPLVIVTRPTLGTINDTLLTLLAARNFGLRVTGLVINHATRVRNDRAVRLNPGALAKFAPVLGIVHHGAGPGVFDPIADAIISS